ncbi:primosomal protein DnaI [Lactobacillus sp. CBA3606]|uniref:primosomal protein DnaI n=1 Tax=Lactobacillus sp. CBA3606 TaxID=2099789 RepID=UPI000CFDB66C|nr:primosomal protein DnaI [Lactobacillus sp. CBA3606]AVK62864.1 primosomal protein DnaI [Lactobacillus sp. CBA3606]
MENISEGLKTLMNKRHLNQQYQELMTTVYQDPDVRQFLAAHQDDLSSDAMERSATKLYEFCQEKQKAARHEPTQAPGYQPELVMSNHLIDIAYQPTPQFQEAQAERDLKHRVRSISMPKNIQSADLTAYDQDGDRATALMAALDFIDAYTQAPKRFHRGLYLYGSFGVGKTFLLGAMANNLATRGFQTTLIHFPSFAVEMKRSISNNTSGDKVDAIKRAPILMIDDIGADSSSTWIRDDVLGVILEYRMQEELPTCFSSNFSMQELQDGYLTVSQKGDEEPIKAQRIMQRIRFLTTEIEMIGQNRRLDSTN